MSFFRQSLSHGLLALLVFPLTLHAATLHSIAAGSTTTTTKVSGSKSKQVTNRSPGQDAFLWGLTFDEKGDKPCFIEAHWWRFTEKFRDDFSTRFDICGDKVDGDKALVFHSKDVTLPGVDSVTVCQASDSDARLKGVTLTAAAIDRDGLAKVESGLLTRNFERPNCSKWDARQSCPSGQVAIGLDIHHDDDVITGLALTCTAPVIGSATATQPATLSSDEIFARFESDIRVQVDENGRTIAMSIGDAVARHEVNAVSVVILNAGKIERVKHYGVKSRKAGAKVDDKSIYASASMSKLPAAIAMLAAARLPHGPNLQRTVEASSKQFPDSVLRSWVDKQFKGQIESGFPADITVERLISHTAGLDTHGIGTAKGDSPTSMKTILLGKLGNPGVKPQAAPGTEWDYSGGGYTAAEAMLEAHSGLKARKFLTQNVLKPFGIVKSTYADAGDGMVNLVRGCSRGSCSEKPEHTEVKFAGGLLANPREYARMLQILMFDGRDPNDASRQLISPADVKRVFTPIGHRDSSRKACTVHSDCRDSESCFGAQCIRPLDAWGDWYGLGVFLLTSGEFEGLPRYAEHGGVQDNAHTQFKIDRQTRDGVVIFVAGDSTWTKDKVTFGASPLLTDIVSSYDRNY